MFVINSKVKARGMGKLPPASASGGIRIPGCAIGSNSGDAMPGPIGLNAIFLHQNPFSLEAILNHIRFLNILKRIRVEVENKAISYELCEERHPCTPF